MLEDLVAGEVAEYRGIERKQIAITIIIALISLGVEIAYYCYMAHKKSKKDILRDGKYPTLRTRLRFQRALRHLNYQGDHAEAEAVILNVLKKADLDDVLSHLDNENRWIF